MISAVASARWVTLSPIMVSGSADRSTMSAASGSVTMLNSPYGVVLPRSVEPPMKTTRRRWPVISGWVRRSSATLVSGPVAISVTGTGDSAISRRISSTACTPAISATGTSRSGPSSPDTPWMSSATVSSPTSGRSQPAATGTAEAPARARIRCALRVVLSSVWLPATVVTPRRRSRRSPAASSRASASS